VSSAGVDVVWRDDGTAGGNGQLRYRRSTDGGMSWGPRVWLTSTSGDVEFPDIAGWGARVHMVWHDDAVGNNEIYHKRRG
jgi:hypothetical protein